MPKVDTKNAVETSLTVNAQAEIKKQTTALLIDNKGHAIKELEIVFSTADKNDKSPRGALVAGLLKRTPNITSLTLSFSGHLHSYSECLGEELLTVLCSLEHIEEFYHRATNSARTDFGQMELMKLVSSWPNLKILYIAGDSNGSRELCKSIPPATCALENVTFERCMADFELLVPMFAGSANSLRTLEIWSMSHNSIESILVEILPAINDLTLGGCGYPSPQFIKDKLAYAPNLQTISFGGGKDSSGQIRKALATALELTLPAPPSEDPEAASSDSPVYACFPALYSLSYPAQSGTYKTGRGRNVRVHTYENPGEEELLAIAGKRGFRASVAYELEYKVEGAQRRAGFAAMGRRW